MKHSELNGILTQMWHRFRSKHSCKAQPFLTTNDLAEAVDDKVQIYMAILGSSKAFDKVAHNGLKHIKLDFYGTCGNLLEWLESFLSNHIHAASAWWLVVPRVLVVLTLPIQPSYQGFLKAQSLALYCYCYTLKWHKYQHSQSVIHQLDDCFVYTRQLINLILATCPSSKAIWMPKLSGPGDGKWNLIILSVRSFKCLATHCTKSFLCKMYGIPLEIVEQHYYLEMCLHHRLSWQPHNDSICNKANCLSVGF